MDFKLYIVQVFSKIRNDSAEQDFKQIYVLVIVQTKNTINI
tara:strand:+ start:537 stop:659 length:123 start_codon:yes stop_codon:yes gene_type:complete